jgi:hypothetical protein
MIIFFALFYVLREIAEWKVGQPPKYGFTVPVLESAQRATIFGVHLYDKLLFPHTAGMGAVASVVAAITVVISATTTFLTVRQSSKRGLMQTNVDPDNPMAGAQKYMMYVVPFFSLTGLYWQFGLVLYWVTTNLWTLGQQHVMFRNWTTEPVPAAGAVAASAPDRSAPGSTRPARTAAGPTRTASNTRTASQARNGASPAAAQAGTGTNGRPARPSAASRPASSASSASTAGSSSGSARPRTGSARSDAAAASASPNGQNGAARRGLLRLGRKQEPAAEPETPVTKVVRQQPVRQAKSKRSGKR